MPEAPSRRIALLLGGLLACVLVVMLSVTLAFRPLPRTPEAAASPAAAPGPRLQSAPQPDLGSYRARKQAELAALGPIENEPGWARIPIDRAMDLMSEHGLRATGAKEASP
ncbi:MAG: hypothetical protein J7549_00730 [Variovorax sp.]|nr:hypothetical protein [Variovorax sp.]